MGRFDIYQEKYIKCIENLISKGYIKMNTSGRLFFLLLRIDSSCKWLIPYKQLAQSLCIYLYA